MVSASAPVFYDCEASSLDGCVIEVAWAFVAPHDGQIVSASYLVHPLPEWRIAESWDENAEALHGISIEDLYARGIPVQAIARSMNEALSGRELFSDSSFDEAWLTQIFDGAGKEPSFLARRTSADHLLEQAVIEREFDAARYYEALDRAEQNRRHRAHADVLQWAHLWRMVVHEEGRPNCSRAVPW